ncbi:MAG: ABC transporter ATP-binding protein [Alphaproteobacteria bacterium]|nr:ABC transporter ATP-binding protein [Alphaproteobacteria bacterium]
MAVTKRADATTRAAAVRFDNVSKTYDGHHLVIDGLSLDIGQGEFLTFLGPSGSGKTTSLMMLAGFETPTSGEIYLDGAPFTNVPPHKRGLGFVFQNYALFPHMSVAENLAFPLEVRQVPRASIKEKVERALTMVSLAGFGERRPQQLSGGQQQRVAVARALVFEPSLILMDEPLGALDKNLREQLQYEIRHLHRNLGVTIVYVTHDQSEAMTLSDRIAVFNKGFVEQIDAPRRLYDEPMTAFVAGFIGENNRLDGELTTLAGERGLVTLSGDCTVDAVCAAGLAPGARVVVSVRPERMSLGAREGANTIAARLEEQVYLGDHLRIAARTPGGRLVIAKIPNHDGLPALSLNDTVNLSFRPEDARALLLAEA